MACATAIICVALLRVERASTQQRFQLCGVDETAGNGKTVKSVYRIDTVSGKTWRVTSKPFFTGAQDEQHNPLASWADGWEEMPDSPEAAIAKEQAGWENAQRAARQTPPP